MIYTSYFAHIKSHPLIVSGKMRAMSIALLSPSGWPLDDWAPALRPWPFMVDYYKAGNLTEFGYEESYRNCVLRNVSPEWILSQYDNCILCCWEGTNRWCHRRIVRKWIAEKTGVKILELDAPDDIEEIVRVEEPNMVIERGKPVEAEQLSLF